jgi:guanidinoacetate N-methyltransferase
LTRRIKRTREFEIALQLTADGFLAPPTEQQRNWLLHRTLGEWAADLRALDGATKRFVKGATKTHLADRTQADLAQLEIMEDWQVPLMRAMADVVTATDGDVLEIGYGRGVSSRFIQEGGVRSHTIIECNDSIHADMLAWIAEQPDRDIRPVHGLWQDVVDDLGPFDAVFFHTYPLHEEELVETVLESPTFAAHFFPTAARLLRPGGVFTYMTNEIDSFSREHQRQLFDHFSSFTLSRVTGLEVPDDVADAWWSDTMVLVAATR